MPRQCLNIDDLFEVNNFSIVTLYQQSSFASEMLTSKKKTIKKCGPYFYLLLLKIIVEFNGKNIFHDFVPKKLELSFLIII